MKRAILFLAIASIGFVACKKEETPAEKTTSQKIVGTWKGDTQTTTITGLPPQTDDLSYVSFNFMSDGTYTTDSAGVSQDNGTWSAPSSSAFVLDSIKFDIRLLNDTQFNLGLDTTIDFFGTPLAVDVLLKMKK
jgi:hypothetical protein